MSSNVRGCAPQCPTGNSAVDHSDGSRLTVCGGTRGAPLYCASRSLLLCSSCSSSGASGSLPGRFNTGDDGDRFIFQAACTEVGHEAKIGPE